MPNTQEIPRLSYDNLQRLDCAFFVDTEEDRANLEDYSFALSDCSGSTLRVGIKEAVVSTNDEGKSELEFALVDRFSIDQRNKLLLAESERITLGIGQTAILGRKPGNTHNLPVAELTYTSEEHLYFMVSEQAGRLVLSVLDKKSTNGSTLFKDGKETLPAPLKRPATEEARVGEPVDLIKPLFAENNVRVTKRAA